MVWPSQSGEVARHLDELEKATEAAAKALVGEEWGAMYRNRQKARDANDKLGEKAA